MTEFEETINTPEPEITVCVQCDVDMSAEDHPSGLCGICEGK